MCELTLEFWREALRRPVVKLRAEVVKEGFWPTTVYRIYLEYADGEAPRTLILKCARPDWPGDLWGAEREYRVYTELLPQVPIPQARRYFTMPGNNKHHTQIVMQDLDDEFVFYPETHAWTWSQCQAMLRTYARLHAAGQMLQPERRPYLMSRLRERWTPQGARAMFADLLEAPEMNARLSPFGTSVAAALDELPRLERLAAQDPLTLVHYDAYPPNIAFSRDAAAPEAVLIDWAMATCDIAEIDLAFIFQQTYGSDRLLDWRAALQYYWEERARITGCGYNWEERVLVFRYARILALFTTLVPLHRAWLKSVREGIPFGPDSPDPYMRFYDATLSDLMDALPELAKADDRS